MLERTAGSDSLAAAAGRRLHAAVRGVGFILRNLRDQLDVHRRKVHFKVPCRYGLELLKHLAHFLSGGYPLLDELCSDPDDRVMHRTQVRPRSFGLRKKETALTHFDQASGPAEQVILPDDVW